MDNLHGEPTDANGFKQLVYEQVLSYCRDGLPARAAIFHDALIVGFNPGYCLGVEHFSIAEL